MKSNPLILFLILGLSCARAPQKLDVSKPSDPPNSGDSANSSGMPDDSSAAEKDMTTSKDGSSSADNSQTSDANKTKQDTGETTDTVDEAYLFDAAFPIAAALVSTDPKVVRTDNQPLGWGETNQYTALFDYMRTSGSTEYKYLVDLIYKKNVGMGEKNFINEFFDDTAWWGLAWIVAYDVTKNDTYLNAAKTIADYIYKNGWNNKCGGGIIWKRGDTAKNAIASGLFLKLTSSLHNRIANDKQYLDIAQKEWDWFINSELVGKSGDEKGIVSDSLTDDCKRSGTAFTYNQGQILGASEELYKATKTQKYLDKAKELSEASRKFFTNDKGLLYERSRAGSYDCNAGHDNIYFKGAYARNLRELNEYLKDSSISDYLMKNAKYAWDTRGDYDAISGCFESGNRGTLDGSYLAPTLDILNGSITKKRSNLALQKSVTTSLASCAENEGPNNIIDGDASTKWCAKAANGGYLDIDLGSTQALHRVRIAHAGAGAILGDVKENNTKAFEILVADKKEGPWTSLAKVTQNKSSGTSTLVNGQGRFLRINISDPGSDGIIRIYELMAE